MAINTAAAKRGWRYDKANARMDCYIDGNLMIWLDPSLTKMVFDTFDVQLGDTDYLKFGDATAGDVSINWTGSVLAVLPATDDTGAINIGNGTTDIDFTVFLGTSAKYVQFDVGNSYLKLVGVSLYAPNLSQTAGQAGIIYYNAAGYLIRSAG